MTRRAIGLVALGELERLEERQRVLRRERRDLVDVLAADRDREDLGLQARAPARLARDDRHVLLELVLDVLGLGLLAAAHDARERALVARVPVRLAPVAREVVDADALVAEPVEQRVLRLLRQVAPRACRRCTPRCFAAAATSCG